MTTNEPTFVFADLAGFTALAEAHGDEHAADVADAFCARVNRLLPAGAVDFKRLGDACLIHAPDASSAVRFGVALAWPGERADGRLGVRVGLHTGPAVHRRDDWYGRGVNLAARVVGYAGPGEAVVSEATRLAAGPIAQVDYQPLGPQPMRNVPRPVQLYRAVAAGASQEREHWIVDPVCRMQLASTECSATREYGCVVFSFCSDECARTFDLDPSVYTPVETRL